MHFLTEYQKVHQTEGDKYGPVSDSQYKVTSRLSLKTGNTSAKVYAAFKGYVMLFDQIDSSSNIETDLVNLILIPFSQNQTFLTPSIQYLVYRGLKRSDFMTASGSNWQIANSGTEMMTKFFGTSGLNHTLDDLMFKKYTDYIGYSSTSSPSKINIALTDLLVNYSRFCTERFCVEEGMHIGEFGSEGLGIDVVNFDVKYNPKMSFAHEKNFILNVTGYNSSDIAGNESASILKFRESIHNFIDPAVFYNIHQEVGVTYHENGTKQTIIKGQDLYDKIIKVFATKNTVYFDIRNDNDFSYNFYQDYQDSNNQNISLSINNANYSMQSYCTNKWPILILDQTPAINEGNYTDFGFEFLTSYNNQPLAFIDFAYIQDVSEKESNYEIRNFNFPIDNKKFITLKVQNDLSSPVNVVVPSYTDTINSVSGKYTGSWINRIYCLRNGSVVGTPPSRLVISDSVYDNIFGYLDNISVGNYVYNKDTTIIKTIGRVGIGKRFIRKGEGNYVERMVQIGVGLAKNDVTFFAVDLVRNTNTNELLKTEWGKALASLSSGNSKYEEFKQSFTNRLNVNFVKVNTSEGSILNLDQGQNPDAKNKLDQNSFFSLNLTRDEVLFIQAVIASSSLDGTKHPICFAFDTNSKEKDTSDFYYGIGRLVLTGLDASGQYTKITALRNTTPGATTTLSAGNLFVYSRDRITYSSLNASADSLANIKIKGRDENRGVFTVSEYIDLVKEVEEAFKKINNNVYEDIEITIARIRSHYYGAFCRTNKPESLIFDNNFGLNVYNGLIFNSAIPNSPKPFGLFQRFPGIDNYKSPIKLESLQALLSHSDENGIEDNPSPYIKDPSNNKIDVGHLLYGLDGLINNYYTTGSLFNNFQIYRSNDFTGYIADVYTAAAESRIYVNGKQSVLGFYYPVTNDKDRLYEISAPLPDLLSDIDAFGLFNVYKYFNANSYASPLNGQKLRLSFLLEYFYKTGTISGTDYPQEIKPHYLKRFTNFCLKYDCTTITDSNQKPECFITQYQGFIEKNNSNVYEWKADDANHISIKVMRRRAELFAHFWYQNVAKGYLTKGYALIGIPRIDIFKTPFGFNEYIEFLEKSSSNNIVRFEKSPLINLNNSNNETNKSIYNSLDIYLGNETNSDEIDYYTSTFLNWIKTGYQSEY